MGARSSCVIRCATSSARSSEYNVMTGSPWSPLATSLLATFLGFYLAAFGLFHLMIYRVNRGLPTDDRIPHSLYFGGWNQLRDLHRGFYPRSSLWTVTMTLAISCLTFALAAASVLVWQFAAGK